MQTDSFVFDPRPNYPLVTTAKRYRHPKFFSEDPDALTLIFAHGTGFHKEQWEPTIDDLLNALKRDNPASAPLKIHEIWNLDCANHGDAAIINEAELVWGYTNVFPWHEYARSIHAFLKGQGTGIPVDFSKRRLVGVGHSMGAISLMLSCTFVSPPKYDALILVEPMLVPPPELSPPNTILSDGAIKRRDIWPNKEAAREAFAARPSWKIWDPRVLEIFTEEGLRDLPTSTYPDKQGVTLKCTRVQEAACYSDKLGHSRAYKLLPWLCDVLPIHVIHGAQTEPYLPSEIKDYVVNVHAKDKCASVVKVQGAGHLVVQTHPRGLADAILTDLRRVVERDTFQEQAVVSRL